MNKEILKNLLAVPTVSYNEQPMVDWLVHYITHNIPGAAVTVDAFRNVYVSKGTAEFSPCVSAHIDTVQPHRQVEIVERNGHLIGFDAHGTQVGIGADDKAGIFVCLNLLHRFEHIRAVFFATEECGCVGARKADAAFFAGIAYLMEFDCPSRNMMSYSSGGVRLFANDGDFIKTALPALQRHGTILWQHHPYSDVMAIRERFPISCLNLSCGYYNWHAPNEFISLRDVDLAIEQGADLVSSLAHVRYECPTILNDLTESLIPVTRLKVPAP